MVINKRAQQMTLGTIIAIVLGIAVLILLIMGFTTGWNNMWNKIDQFGGGSTNVDDVSRGCEVACAQNSVDDFCRKSRTVNYDDDVWEKGSCESLSASKKIDIKSCSITCDKKIVPALTNGE